MKVEDFQEMPWWQIPVKIVSGGQTGVDRAALDAARAAHLPYGGWLPKGRLTEEGPLPAEYVGMSEMPTKDYLKRTEKNVVDSEMTVVICRGEPEGGTKRTIGFAEKHNRPCCVCDLDRTDDVDATIAWVRETEAALWSDERYGAEEDPESGRPVVINFAGPRGSKDPAIYDDAKRVIARILGNLI